MSEKKAEGGKKGLPLPMIIIAVVAVIAMVGTFVIGKSVAAKGTTPEKKKVEKGPIMTLDEFLVNLADPSGDHFLKVTVGIELNKEKGKTPESLKEQVAPIRDAVLTSLTSKTRDEVTPIAGREKLKAEIKKKINEALGEDDVQNVYFTNFVTQ